jgi:hypothetical protein
LSPFEKEVLETSWDAFSKASATQRGHTLVYLLSSQTSQNISKSHMKNLSVIINLIKGEITGRLTVGGDRFDYSGEVETSTADITTFNILINGTLSTKDA